MVAGFIAGSGLGSIVAKLLPDLCGLQPEVAFAYSGAAFNEEFGPAALARIARDRAEARRLRKLANFQRYRRRYFRQAKVDYWRYLQLHR